MKTTIKDKLGCLLFLPVILVVMILLAIFGAGELEDDLRD